MTVRSLALAPLAALERAGLEAVAPAPRRTVGKGAPAARPVPVAPPAPEPSAVQAAPARKPVGPTDPLRHAVFLAKTLRRA